MAARKKPSFEAGMEALEEIVRRMEEDALTLEESLATYEKGVELYRVLSAQLEQSEKQMRTLLPEEQGAES